MKLLKLFDINPQQYLKLQICEKFYFLFNLKSKNRAELELQK